MPVGSRPLDRILVPLDFSQVTKPILEIASLIASRYGSEIVLMHAIEEHLVEHVAAGYNVSELISVLESKAREALEAYRRELAGRGLRVNVYTDIPVADPAVAIASAAEDVRATEILVASKGWGWRRLIPVGSTSRLLVKIANKPVIYFRASKRGNEVTLLAKEQDPFKLIAYAYRPGHPPEFTDYIISLAKRTSSSILVVSIAEDKSVDELSKELDSLLEEFSYAGVKAERVVLPGKAHHDLLRVSEGAGASLIALGRTVKREVHEFILGTTLGRLLSTTRLPLLIYPTSG